MAYVVLARKWRPMTFENVIGQEHVTRTLMNALKNQRVAHAYIFAGPRGVGKTTTARLLAKAVNCENQPAVNPCNECSTCKAITQGISMDVIEIDGASNRGIDEIRNLRENIRFAPVSAKYKIYIIDEVHMLTKEAFNALLKTLEEPPAHAIFIFATTEIHKVPLTILSRCQRFDFKRIPVKKIQDQLKTIVEAESIEIDDEALLLIARKAEGSMRDAESILDQMISFGEGKLSAEVVRESLGLIDQDVYFEFSELLQEKDNAKILNYANKIINSGHDILDFLQGLQEHFRNMLIMCSLNNPNLLDVSDYYRERYVQESNKFRENDLIHYLQIINDEISEFKFSTFPQLSLEMLLLKLAHKPPCVTIEEILALLEKLKKNPELTVMQHTRRSVAPSDAESAANYQAPTSQPSKITQGRTQITEPGSKPISDAGLDLSQLEEKLSSLKQITKPATKLNQDTKSRLSVDVDLNQVKQIWPKVVEKVISKKIALGSFLQEGLPYALDGNNLIIAYNKGSEFHKEHVNNNRKFIEDILEKEFNLILNIRLKTIDFAQEGIEIQPRTPEEILEDIKKKEPIIRKIIEVFQLENADKHNTKA